MKIFIERCLEYNMLRVTIFFILLFFTACEEKSEPRVTKSTTISSDISCLQLDSLGVDKLFVNKLNSLYSFNKNCDFSLNISSKKDIVCNSSHNMMSKNMGKFPKSFIKLEVRRGMKIEYSYYIDLFHNADEDDLAEGFNRLKRDLQLK